MNKENPRMFSPWVSLPATNGEGAPLELDYDTLDGNGEFRSLGMIFVLNKLRSNRWGFNVRKNEIAFSVVRSGNIELDVSHGGFPSCCCN